LAVSRDIRYVLAYPAQTCPAVFNVSLGFKQQSTGLFGSTSSSLRRLIPHKSPAQRLANIANILVYIRAVFANCNRGRGLDFKGNKVQSSAIENSSHG